ncbi:MAG: Hsp70 family protein [Synechococcus sp. SB0673_bin_10]|nr:Hsp70 family protein [Synechococcus sp. SB0678_bin_12]MYI71027.1 Hsp70 family protein [Synechococcus sp. SB0673_bin_10]MYI87287.1 Hsp70 family protein [Synechococcus sp. SB0672_bin_10]
MKKTYVGIDLGTTNSVICSYQDGRTRISKSPEQNDVTPSAIYIGPRDNKYVGQRAYASAPHNPGNVATLFKRFMGTSTPIKLPAVDKIMTPEQCSAEVLRTLFGYLPEELRQALRNDPEVGTVITVPAAFNQMQKTATMDAAELAGIGKVALMQEPVAAVMSAVKARNANGAFLIYDLGGGTLDIALAESSDGHINLLAQDGLPMLGGRDFDRQLVTYVVKPWLCKTFNLPDDYWLTKNGASLRRLATWAAERAKIELSSREEAVITLPETEVNMKDQSDQDIYIDVDETITRDILKGVIYDKVDESIAFAREVLDKAGLTAHDVECIVFIGGPTHFHPLRVQVSEGLGIPASFEVDPMTAVAEGAALFAESIDWTSQNRRQKSRRGEITTGGTQLDLAFNYEARTPNKQARIRIQARGEIMTGTEYQVESLDTGWSSGRLPLKEGETIDVSLSMDGENRFKVIVFDAVSGQSTHRITITRTPPTVDAVPCSRAIGLEVREKLGSARTIMLPLVKEGDQLPKKGRVTVKAEESLRAGSDGSLNFKLWEGDSDIPENNRPIGSLKIKGDDFIDGVIPAGADLLCNYEMLDSGEIVFKVSAGCVGVSCAGKFYSRKEGQSDYSETSTRERVRKDGESTLQRIKETEKAGVYDAKLEEARKKVKAATEMDRDQMDRDEAAECVKEADEGVIEARLLLDQVCRENRQPIRQTELDSVTEDFDAEVRQGAPASRAREFDNLARTAQRSIERDDNDFEDLLSELKSKSFSILWQQDWYVVKHFKLLASFPYRFSDQARFKELVAEGTRAIKSDNIGELRQVIAKLHQIMIATDSQSTDALSDEDKKMKVNIIRGW